MEDQPANGEDLATSKTQITTRADKSPIYGILPHLPDETYVGIRGINQTEILKSEKNKPPVPKSAADVRESFRSADSLHAKHQPAPRPRCRNKSTNPFIAESYPPLKAIHQPRKKTCVNIQEDRLHHGKEFTQQCQWDMRRRAKEMWKEQLPYAIHALPIHTLRVRWPLRHHGWTFSVEMIHLLLSRYGHIVSFGQLSPNSAIVVFQTIKIAAQVISCSQKSATPPFICRWWYEEMWSYDCVMKERKLQEKCKLKKPYDELTVLKIKFKLVQTKVSHQIRKARAHMSYDHENFTA